MTPEQELKTQLNIAQHKAASTLQAVSILLGLAGAIWQGLPALLAGLGFAFVFHLAKPGPTEELDKANGRK